MNYSHNIIMMAQEKGWMDKSHVDWLKCIWEKRAEAINLNNELVLDSFCGHLMDDIKMYL